MDTLFWAGIVISVLVAGAALLFVVWPIVQSGPTLPLVDDDRLVDLLARKDILLLGIKELDFDHHMGKISNEDYARFSARLRRQALGVMQQIDRIAPESAALDAELEAEIARLRKVQSSVEALPAGSSVGTSSAQANGAEASADPAGKFCPQCGKPLAATHKFCAECGTPVGQG